MTVLGRRPLGRPYLGRISQTVGGAGAGSGSASERDIGFERSKNIEIRARPRLEFKLFDAMGLDCERGLGGRRRGVEVLGVGRVGLC